MNLERFDECARMSSRDFVETSRRGTLVPSIAHGMAVRSAASGAMQDVVSQFWNDDRVTVQNAQERLARAAQTR